MKKIFLFMLLLVFLISNIQAVAQVNFNTANGIEIDYPKYDYVKLDAGFNLTIHNYNISNGKLLSGSNCSLEIFNHSGYIVYEKENLTSTDSKKYFVLILDSNFSSEDQFTFNIYCENNNIGGFASGLFEVNKNGKEEATGIVKVAFFISFLLLLFYMLFSFLKMLGHWKDLEVDILDLAGAIGLYLVLFGYHYLAFNYWGDITILNILDSLLIAGAVTHVFSPVAAFLTSLIYNPLRKEA